MGGSEVWASNPFLCGVNGAWEFQALRLWGVSKCFREMFEQKHQYTGTSFSVPWWDQHRCGKREVAGCWRSIRELLTAVALMLGLYVLVIYCCVVNRPQTKWLKTKIMSLSLMFSLGQKFGKGSSRAISQNPKSVLLFQSDSGHVRHGGVRKEKLEAGRGTPPSSRGPSEYTSLSFLMTWCP